MHWLNLACRTTAIVTPCTQSHSGYRKESLRTGDDTARTRISVRTSVPGGVFRPKDNCIPHHDVVGVGRAIYSLWGVLPQTLEVSHETLRCIKWSNDSKACIEDSRRWVSAVAERLMTDATLQ